jgi:hypothetical protein
MMGGGGGVAEAEAKSIHAQRLPRLASLNNLTSL